MMPVRVYVHNRTLDRFGPLQRMVAGVVSVGALAMLAVGAWLEPSTSGVNTHTQLGLQACGLLASSGVPCPTCGMTTAVSLAAHGRLLSSFITQPAGLMIALLTAATFWTGLYIAATGLPGVRWVSRLASTRNLFALVAIALLAWAYKIAVMSLAAGR